MVSLFILGFACFALVNFAVSQWRAIWISTANRQLSSDLQIAAGLSADSIGAEDFGEIIQICEQMSPGLAKSSVWIREVALYYRGIEKLEKFSSAKIPAIAAWAKREMQICSRYLAVVLDQKLMMNIDRGFTASRSNS